MADNDQLHRFIFENTSIRGEYVHLDSTFQAALSRHDYPPVVANILGQAMAATVLLGATVKFEGSLILQVQGNGPMSLLVVQLSSDGSLRGLANWNDETLPDSDHLVTLFGEGRLVITIEASLGNNNPKKQRDKGERYQGIVDLGAGNIGEALEGYFKQSEQLRTRLWLTVNESRAAGLLIQAMPSNQSATVENNDEENWKRIDILSSTITNEEMMGLPFREIIHRLYNEEDVRIFDPEIVRFRCTCSRARIKDMLRSLGEDEVKQILLETQKVEVDCEYCKQHYSFDAIDVEKLFIDKITPDIPRTKH